MSTELLPSDAIAAEVMYRMVCCGCKIHYVSRDDTMTVDHRAAPGGQLPCTVEELHMVHEHLRRYVGHCALGDAFCADLAELTKHWKLPVRRDAFGR